MAGPVHPCGPPRVGPGRCLAYRRALHRASGNNALQDAIAPYFRGDPLRSKPGHRRHRFFIDQRRRRVRFGAHLSRGAGERIATPLAAATRDCDQPGHRRRNGIRDAGALRARRFSLPPPARHLADRQQRSAEKRPYRWLCRDLARGNQPSRVGKSRRRFDGSPVRPPIVERSKHLLIVDAIDEGAKDTKVALFRRFAWMRDRISSGHYKTENIVSIDGLYMNDAGYGCIAVLLADSLAAQAESQKHVARQSGTARVASGRVSVP